MEWLGIEFGRESLDLLLVDPQSPGTEGLTHREVFQISPTHSALASLVLPLERSGGGAKSGSDLCREECIDVGCKLSVLPSEAVSGIGINPDLSIRYKTAHEMGEPRWAHQIIIAVGDQRRLLKGSEAL